MFDAYLRTVDLSGFPAEVVPEVKRLLAEAWANAQATAVAQCVTRLWLLRRELLKAGRVAEAKTVAGAAADVAAMESG